MAQIGAPSLQTGPSPDDVVDIVAPHLGEHVLLILPDAGDHRLRVIFGAFEARVWSKNSTCIYEIASRKAGLVMARGEAGSAYAALERTLPLLAMLNECSGVKWRAA